MLEELKKEVDETTNPESSQDEEKKDNSLEVDETTQKKQESEEQEEKVSVSKKEFENLKKKAEDFEKSTKLKQILKFKDKILNNDDFNKESKDDDNNNNNNNVDVEEIARRVAEETTSKLLLSSQKKEFGENLEKAFSKFLDDNPWAEDEEITQKISENFKPGKSVSEEDILAGLETAAAITYPMAYKEAIAMKERSKILVQSNNIDLGDAGSVNSLGGKTKTSKQISKEDQAIADRFFGGDVERYLQFKSK
jgi:hypothetical protein